MSLDDHTKSKPATQRELANKALALKVTNEAKREKPAWLRLPPALPAKPTVETPDDPERERAADRSQGPPRLVHKASVSASRFPKSGSGCARAASRARG